MRAFLVVDVLLQFGSRGSSGWFGLVASAMEDDIKRTTKKAANFTPVGIRTTEHPQFAQPSGKYRYSASASAMSSEDVDVEGVEDSVCTRFFADDAISMEVCSMEVQHEAEGRRCEAFTTGIANLHQEMLGERREAEDKVIAQKKMIDLDSEHAVLGRSVDTDIGTISMPGEKVQDLTRWLDEWPDSRKTATVKKSWYYQGNCTTRCLFLCPGSTSYAGACSWRGCISVGAKRAGGAGTWGRQKKNAHPGNVLRQSKAFMADVAWWKWCLGEGIGQAEESLNAPSLQFRGASTIEEVVF